MGVSREEGGKVNLLLAPTPTQDFYPWQFDWLQAKKGICPSTPRL
jgi:hypothetical protein